MKNKTKKYSEFRIPNSEFEKSSEFQILNTSGASLLFVLAVMFLLLAVGTSVLVAASAGRGQMARQAIHNQAMLLDESVHSNIRRSLQNNTDPNSLGTQIIMAAYEAHEAGGRLGDIVLGAGGITFDNGFNVMDASNNTRITGITLRIIEPEVHVISERSPEFIEDNQVDSQGNPIIPPGWVIADRVPRTATVNLRLIVSVVIAAGERTFESEAEYIFAGDEFGLSDADIGNPGAGLPPHTCTVPGTPFPPCHPSSTPGCIGTFIMRVIDGGGTWELVRRGEMIHR